MDRPKRDSIKFKQRCDGLGIRGISLHSYRYSWAGRAKTAGYPERFAQLALGHNSKAVHRAYARKAQVTLTAVAPSSWTTVITNLSVATESGLTVDNKPQQFI
jgi:integrase